MNPVENGTPRADQESCVPVSNEITQASDTKTGLDTTYGPAEIYEHVQDMLRIHAVETAVATLQKHGWRWEQFDPGRSGLVPAWRKGK